MDAVVILIALAAGFLAGLAFAVTRFRKTCGGAKAALEILLGGGGGPREP